MKIVKNEVMQSSTTAPTRRAYQAPKLTEYGDVRHLTQGGTQGTAEAGNSNANFMA